MNQLSDEELIARCASGDRRGMDVLVSRYHGKLLEFAQRHLGNPDASADVAQTTLVKVFQSAAGFRGTSSFRTWLYTIALNMIRDDFRRRKCRGESLLSEIDDGNDDPPEYMTTEDSTENIALKKIESVAIWRAVDGLPEKRRSAVILKFRMGLTYDEIASVMGVPDGTVKSWVHYALKKLRKSLEREDSL
ncbi:MAG: RNA polymerase sigma factor [Armatimonadota bacterium]|nr:RNA polymerase sigma factor [bacterium]